MKTKNTHHPHSLSFSWQWDTEFHSSSLVAVFRCLYGVLLLRYLFLLIVPFFRVLPLEHSGQFCRLRQTPQCFCFEEKLFSRSFWHSTKSLSLSDTTTSNSLKIIRSNSRDFPASLKKWIFNFSDCRPITQAALIFKRQLLQSFHGAPWLPPNSPRSKNEPMTV